MLAVLLTLASCSQRVPTNVVGPPPLIPEPRRSPRLSTPPSWYWEPVEVDRRPAETSIDLPMTEDRVLRALGGNRVWDALGPSGRERLLRDGLVIVPRNEASNQVGALYTKLREQRVPYVVTLDALAYALHVAFERALAEVDDTLLAPGLDALLERLEARLGAEQKGAGVELGAANGLARAIVAVARGLASPGAKVAGPALAPETMALVSEEIALIEAHAKVGTSPLLAVPIDYARFDTPADAAHPGSFRALTWLASAPLLFAAEGEVPGSVVGIARSRLLARAAMVLARLSLPDVDPAIFALWSRITRVLAFVWGAPDDVSALEFADLASSMGIGLENPKHIANVVTVDRLRRRAAAGRVPLVFDGAGASARAGVGMRIFGGHASADSVALAAMSGPNVGATHAAPPPVMARDGQRTLPSSLDLAAWLGAREGRAAVHEQGHDQFAGYDAALERAAAARPDQTRSRSMA